MATVPIPALHPHHRPSSTSTAVSLAATPSQGISYRARADAVSHSTSGGTSGSPVPPKRLRQHMPQKAGKEGNSSARALLLTPLKSWATSTADIQHSCGCWGSGHSTTASCNEVTTAQPWEYLAAETQAPPHLKPVLDWVGLQTRAAHLSSQSIAGAKPEMGVLKPVR